MIDKPASAKPKLLFVASLPDLITEADYMEPERKRIRLRLSITDDGIEILGDSMYADLVEDLLASAGADEIERMLCG
ncbi:MAG TPA: radical SAM-modified peptide, FtsH ternary system-associated [Pyrinomonadaceae bacterium]|nr:radical SAM-modified peptide, FtsH ternary system-associated [Pyrinomonadaceae bacterium]